MILVHGRGASAEDILGLADELGEQRFAYLAPQAAGHTWYPSSFLAPVAHNEPGRSSGLGVLDRLVDRLGAAGIPAERTIVLGFSQGACLALEFAARHPRRFGGVVGFTGGLIGPPEALVGFDGSLDGTPVFLGSSDPDPHVPWQRVEQTAAILGRLGAEVTLRRYRGMGHTIHPEEIEHVRGMMAHMLAAALSA
jgi:predicted esterase